jgi:hypothetical protein
MVLRTFATVVILDKKIGIGVAVAMVFKSPRDQGRF